MKTTAEIRRERLEQLIAQHQSIANLNVALGRSRADPKLAQIRNANTRADRGKPYQMGDVMAREIEQTLGLERGWMDNAPTEQELDDEHLTTVLQIMRKMPDWQRHLAARVVATLAEADGTYNT